MGKKYIIELEDKPFNKENGDFLYRVKGFNSLVFDRTGINKLIPYTEPDLGTLAKENFERGYRQRKAEEEKEIQEAYQRGLNDAWDAARTLWNTPNRKEIFGHTTFNTVLTTLTAQEAIEKIRQYEQSVTAEDVMRQYLDTFCSKCRGCKACILNTPDFTCGRGYHFLTDNRVSDEEVRRAYAEVLQKVK